MLECGYVLLFLTLAFCDALWIWPFGHIRIRGMAGLWLSLLFYTDSVCTSDDVHDLFDLSLGFDFSL